MQTTPPIIILVCVPILLALFLGTMIAPLLNDAHQRAVEKQNNAQPGDHSPTRKG